MQGFVGIQSNEEQDYEIPSTKSINEHIKEVSS